MQSKKKKSKHPVHKSSNKKQDRPSLQLTTPLDGYFKKAFWIIFTGASFLLPYLSFDFGITWDETLQNEYGKEILKYFETFGKEKKNILPGGYILHSVAIYNYGGLFDFLAAFSNKYLSPFGEYETRHIINSLFGLFAILFTSLLAKSLAGWRAGLICLLFMLCSPRFIGHSINNPKDIPFAAAYIFSIYYLIVFLKQLPKPNIKTMVFLSAGIALSINIRIGGLLIVAYILFFSSIQLIPVYLKNNLPHKTLKKLTFFLLGIIVPGYFAGLIFWPYAHQAPLSNPFNALAYLSTTAVAGEWTMLFEGETILTSDAPWYYIFKWIIISTPLFLLFGLSLLLIQIKTVRKYKESTTLLLIAFTFIFPILYTMYKGSIIYDGWRHFIFTYPALIILSAIGVDIILRKYSNKIQYFLYFIILILLVIPVRWSIKNHPHEYVYFNALAGGLNSAWDQYETDYWGNSLRYAAEWLGDHCNEKYPGEHVTIFADGHPESTSYYLKPKLGGNFTIDITDQVPYDFAILYTRYRVNNPKFTDTWPPQGTIYEVKADNATLCAIVEYPHQFSSE